MFKRMIQGISQLFTARYAATRGDGRTQSPRGCATQRNTYEDLTTDRRSRAQKPPTSFSPPRLRVNGYAQPKRRDETPCHHNATWLLRDGRLQIGITGFHDTAFNVSTMGRHDSPQLAAAITDLPCRVKMVANRNIADGLLTALRTLGTSDAGRRGIVLVTSGDSSIKEDWTRELAGTAVQRRIGIHVICLGPKAGDATCGPRINTKNTLGYGGFRVVETADQLLAAIRDAFDGLTPAFGMRGTNRAVILLDCSEYMVESYRNTTRISMVADALLGFLENPLVRSCSRPTESDRGHQSCPVAQIPPTECGSNSTPQRKGRLCSQA